MDLTPRGIARLLWTEGTAESVYRNYRNSYIRIEESIQNFDGLKANVHIYDTRNSLDLVRLFSLMFDITTASLPPDYGGFSNYPVDDIFGQGHGSVLFFLPKSWSEDPPWYRYDVSMRLRGEHGPANDDFLREVHPLLETGRFIIRPEPRVQIATMELDKLAQLDWFRFGPPEIDSWETLRTQPINRPVPVLQQNFGRQVGPDLQDIAIPYISDIPMDLYSRILDDEAHLLAALRLALQTAAQEVGKNGLNASEVRNDIIRPQLDRLGKRLAFLSDQQSIKRVGYFCTAIFSLVPVAFDMASAMVLGVGAAAGATAVISLTHQELNLRRERHELMDNPIYILWRLQGVRKHGC